MFGLNGFILYVKKIKKPNTQKSVHMTLSSAVWLTYWGA